MKLVKKFVFCLGAFLTLIILACAFILPAQMMCNIYDASTTTVVAEPNFTDTVAQSVKGVVHIRCPQWQGSGFIIDEHHIMTARHVVDGVEDFEITLYDGTKVKATRAISSKNHDIAVIRVEEELSNPVELGSIKDCVLGQDIYAIGSPYGKINFNSLTKGIVSGLDRDLDFTDYRTGDKYGWSISFTTDAAGHPGNSGCAVFTMDGKVRGVLVGGFSPVLIIVMPVDIILDDLEEIELMFIQDEYELEKEPDWAAEAWGH